ncbi:fungal pheromone STE3G-protein-coupled receptor [Exidia glandulosa HHB12029]|uniref:Fungal pheromone STE3G-protein-coupled receptor n=1 Tax=Exidia glandulosa HHB12029 TaxID=1314781 RepID=A0A165D7Q5_EXIGL|nr:fungal pheromone STE3G-protein-coupled receptor [Exidia glandulosa HHB12029]
MGHYELPIFSFLAVLLVLLPLPWHIKARNVATLSLIAWLAVCNFMRGVNAVIWMNNVHIHYRVWCDITAKAFIGMGVALPACSFCITRYLEHVSSARYAVTTAADKRRRQKIDLCFTFGLPIIIMCLHYVVQGHRFDIIEHTGCQPHIYISIPGIIICFVPAIILSLGSIIYAALALHHFAKRRFEFEQHLRDSQSSLNTGRYLRLMGLALTEMGWGESLGLYTLYRNTVLNQVRPWTNWNDVHYNFSRIAIWPQFLIPPGDWARLMLLWWILPATAMLFFLFFGFSEEAIEGYVACYRWFRRTILRQTLPVASTTGSYGKGLGTSLPQFNKYVPPIGWLSTA